MTEDGGFRRLLPPPRRKPTLLDLVLRWRAELVLLGGAAALWWAIGTTAAGLVALAITIVATVVPPVRAAASRLERTLVVPHRLRSALVQGGVADRSGRLPWLVWSRPSGPDVLVHVWLRAGVTPDDLRAAIPLIKTSCGATNVLVVSPDLRPDRALVRIIRPRWGRLRR